MVIKEDFFGIPQYTLSSEALSVTVISFGATVKSIKLCGKELTLNYNTLEEYKSTTCYPGALVGRYANRIKEGKLKINGKEYQLDVNNGKNHLHGGFGGTDKKVWQVSAVEENSVLFTCFSPDGECGYPGNMEMGVKYSVCGNRFRIDFFGRCDTDTVFAPTTHTYFNLGGTPTVFGTKIKINGAGYLPVDEGLIPTGEVLPLEGDFGFSEFKEIQKNYDHCFVLNNGENAFCAASGGVCMTVSTDFPAIQLYTGEFLQDGLKKNSGFAAEPEFCPDSPNKPQFASPLLEKGKEFKKYVEYTFENIQNIKK